MLRRDIAASSLKFLWANIDPVKSYDKTNIIVFASCLWEKYRWGLICFGLFKIISVMDMTVASNGH